MMARVRGVMAASICVASIRPVSASTSTHTGVPPSSTITSAVAAKVKGVVMTSSPGCKSNAMRLMSSASVPLDTVMQCFDPVRAASAASSSATSGPMMYWPCSSTRCMRSAMRACNAAYWVLRLMNSMRRFRSRFVCKRPVIAAPSCHGTPAQAHTHLYVKAACKVTCPLRRR